MPVVAAAQFASIPGEKEQNLSRSLEWIRKAAAGGANLVVLPECCNTGYDLRGRGQVQRLAEPVPDGPACRAWASVARELGVYVAAGLVEVDGQRCYNTAVLIGPEGLVGSYRKTHLFYEETKLYDPGDVGFPVWDTPLGRIGFLICYDLRFPEAARLLSLAGADLVLVPTAWVVLAGQGTDERGYCMQAYCAMALSSMTQMVFVCADTVGPWRNGAYLGGSLITGASGWPLAGPAPADREAVISAAVDIEAIRRSRQRNPFNHTLGDRRTDLYHVSGRD